MNVGQMLRIAHSVSDKVHTVNHSTTIEEVAKKLSEKRIGALPVLKDGILVGIISERDIAIRLVAEGSDPRKTKVSRIMTPNDGEGSFPPSACFRKQQTDRNDLNPRHSRRPTARKGKSTRPLSRLYFHRSLISILNTTI